MTEAIDYINVRKDIKLMKKEAEAVTIAILSP
jgi:hypothetical protein